MRRLHYPLLALLCLSTLSCQAQTLQEMAKPATTQGRTFHFTDPKPGQAMPMAKRLWRYTLTDDKGMPYPLKRHKGKVVLLVNTASHCGYTKQYEGLETLYRRYKDKGLVVIGVPCNQFGTQEPGTAEEIATFCRSTYDVSFDLMHKSDVNGTNALPVYHFLKQRAPQNTGADIRWNFTKFLIGRDGKSVTRYESNIAPEALIADIEAALQR